MATVELTKENFDNTINGNSTVIIDFWASWCGPCQNFAPIYETVSENHKDVVFGKVNTEQEQELATNFQVRSIPTLMIFRDQIMIFSQPGMLAAAQFEELLGKAKELDMDEVRAEIAKQQGEQKKA